MQKIQSLLPKYAKANRSLVKIALSPNEKHNDALVIHPTLPAPHQVASSVGGEILHVHEGTDWSMHCLLSPLDCKLSTCGLVQQILRSELMNPGSVIDRGRGERHPMSGSPLLVKEYVTIYTPRNDEELRVVEAIARASIGYMTGSREVRDF